MIHFYLFCVLLFLVVVWGAEKKRPKAICKDPLLEIAKISSVIEDPDYDTCLTEAQFDIMAGIESVDETQTKIICGSKACHGLQRLVNEAGLDDCLLSVIGQEIAINYDVNSIFERCGNLYTPVPQNPTEKSLSTSLLYAVPPLSKNESANTTDSNNTNSSTNATTNSNSTQGNASCSIAITKTINDIVNSTDAKQCRNQSNYDLLLSHGDTIPNEMCTVPQCHQTWTKLTQVMSLAKPCIVDIDGIPLNLTLALHRIDEKCSFTSGKSNNKDKTNDILIRDKTTENNTDNTNMAGDNNNGGEKTTNNGSMTVLSVLSIFFSISAIFMI